MAEPNNAPRPSSPAMEETTPLLSTCLGESFTQKATTRETGPLSPSSIEDVESSASPPLVPWSIKILTSISLISSIITLILILGTIITTISAPYRSYDIWFSDSAIALIVRSLPPSFNSLPAYALLYPLPPRSHCLLSHLTLPTPTSALPRDHHLGFQPQKNYHKWPSGIPSWA